MIGVSRLRGRRGPQSYAAGPQTVSLPNTGTVQTVAATLERHAWPAGDVTLTVERRVGGVWVPFGSCRAAGGTLAGVPALTMQPSASDQVACDELRMVFSAGSAVRTVANLRKVS